MKKSDRRMPPLVPYFNGVAEARGCLMEIAREGVLSKDTTRRGLAACLRAENDYLEAEWAALFGPVVNRPYCRRQAARALKRWRDLARELTIGSDPKLRAWGQYCLERAIPQARGIFQERTHDDGDVD